MNGFPDYLIKWVGLPYSECTWEDGALVATRFHNAIEQYNLRNKSAHVPSKNCRVSTRDIKIFLKMLSFNLCCYDDKST